MTNMKKHSTAALVTAILTAVLTIPATAKETPAKSIRVSSYKGTALKMFVGIPNSVNFHA